MSKARLRPMQLFNMSGKVCIVTGASSGLGERFVRVITCSKCVCRLLCKAFRSIATITKRIRDIKGICCKVRCRN